jgi:hypothetical protein
MARAGNRKNNQPSAAGQDLKVDFTSISELPVMTMRFYSKPSR